MLRDDDIKEKYSTGTPMDEGIGNSYDFGARIYDPRVGRFLSLDPLMVKYPSISPYAYCLNNPSNVIDKDGRDVILLVWATGNGHYGHAAIAVSNYKMTYYKATENGQEITKSKLDKDGTYTYYDLWTGKDDNNDGVSDGIGSAGPRDMFSGPIAHYQIKKKLSENDLVYGDPSSAEGYPTDGAIKLYSGIVEDMETIDDIKSHISNNKEYTSVNNNCSDLAATGVSEVLDRFRWIVELNRNESAYGLTFTTPNALFKYVQERINSNPQEGELLKDPGSKTNTEFKDAVIEPAKQELKQIK